MNRASRARKEHLHLTLLRHRWAAIAPGEVDGQACQHCGINDDGDMLAVENECPVQLRAELDWERRTRGAWFAAVGLVAGLVALWALAMVL